MPKFNKISDLVKHLNQNVLPDILANEVYSETVNTESKMVQKHVYGAYDDPVAYERRGINGGLADPNNHIATFTYSVNQVKMLVQNTTKGKNQNMYIGGLIEYGHNNGYGEYQFPYRKYEEPTFLNPRRFTYHTIMELQQTLDHVKAFKRGLKRYNIKVR